MQSTLSNSKVLPGLIAVFIAVLAVVFSIVLTRETLTTQQVFDWKSDWAVEKGFDITVDAQGLRFPTALAFIPNPGPAPKDPLYFVTELSGQVRVVTNDRTVITFAEDFDGFPMFSPDGKKLVWASNRYNSSPGNTNVFIADWVE